jgi:hypothetical protein
MRRWELDTRRRGEAGWTSENNPMHSCSTQEAHEVLATPAIRMLCEVRPISCESPRLEGTWAAVPHR